jgi:hypothetical protein
MHIYSSYSILWALYKHARIFIDVVWLWILQWNPDKYVWFYFILLFSDENILYTSITLSLTFIWKYNFKKNVDTTNFHQCSKHEPRHERQWDGCCPPHGSIVSAWCGWFVFSILLNFINKLFHTQYPSESRCVFHHILYTFNTLCAGITPWGWANDKKTANSASSE